MNLVPQHKSRTIAVTFILLAILTITRFSASAQEKPLTEIAALQARYDAKLAAEIVEPHKLRIANLKDRYLITLEKALQAAQKAGKLDEALLFKAEKDAITSGTNIPAENPSKAPPNLDQLRQSYRRELGEAENERDKKLKPLNDAFAKSLATVIENLTKQGKLTEAMVVQKKRGEIMDSSNSGKPILSAAASGDTQAKLDLEGSLRNSAWEVRRGPNARPIGQITFHESGNRVTYSGAGPGTWEVVKNNVVVILLDKGEKQTITVNPKSGTAVSDGSPEGKGYLRRIRK